MGIIDVTLERPALKRAIGTEPTADDPERTDQEPATPRRGRTLLKTLGAIAIGLAGMATFRKLRG